MGRNERDKVLAELQQRIRRLPVAGTTAQMEFREGRPGYAFT